MDTMIQDFRYGVRMLLKRPAITLIAIGSLALGIGANTTIFTVVNAVFLNPLPVRDSSRLVEIYMQDARGTGAQFAPTSYPNASDFREQNSVLSGMATFMGFGVAFRVEGDETAAQNLGGTLVTGNYFEVLGVDAAAGRLPNLPAIEDDRNGAHPELVLSYGLAEDRFAEVDLAIGATVFLNNYPFTVVGVAAPNFKGTVSVANPNQVWAQFSMREQLLPPNFVGFLGDRRAAMTANIGRLAPGATLEQAQAEFTAIAQRLEQEYPTPNSGRTETLVPLSSVGANQQGAFGGAGRLMMGVVGLVLLIACANVANLLLARAVEREKEVAVRVALGASRVRLIRQLLTESLLLAASGGLAGLVIAFWSRDILWSFRPPFLADNAVDLSLNPAVLAFTCGVSLITGVVFGLVPALQASNPDLKSTLQEGGRRGSSGTTKLWLRSGLVIAEVALALMTLVGAGLFVRSMQKAQEIEPGFETDRLVVLFMNLASAGYDEGQQIQFYRDVVGRVESLGGVESAAISQNFPLGGGFLRSVFPEGVELDPELRVLTFTNPITPGYFRTLDIPFIRGRDFEDLDNVDSPFVAIVNEATRDRFWPGEDPIGKRFRFFASPEDRHFEQYVEVVGFVQDQLTNIGQPAQPIMYTPHEQWFGPGRVLNVRTAGAPGPIVGALQTLIRNMEPNLPINAPTTIRQTLDQQLWAPRMGAGLLAIFGLLALALAMVGIYGVMSNAVDQRSHEMGIRMALGARRRQVVSLAVKQGMALVGVGIALGLGGAFVLGRQLEAMLFDLTGTDPVTFIGVAVVLSVVAYLATYLPARRLTRLDPSAALRAE